MSDFLHQWWLKVLQYAEVLASICGLRLYNRLVQALLAFRFFTEKWDAFLIGLPICITWTFTLAVLNNISFFYMLRGLIIMCSGHFLFFFFFSFYYRKFSLSTFQILYPFPDSLPETPILGLTPASMRVLHYSPTPSCLPTLHCRH